MPFTLHPNTSNEAHSHTPRRVESAESSLFAVELPVTTTTREAIRQHHRVRYFDGGSAKSEAYPNRGRTMAAFPFVQINPKSYLNFLVVDVDHSDAEIRLLHPALPQPHWIIVNPDNGHAQAGWMIEPVACAPEARSAPQEYAQSVLASLDHLAGADQAFTRHLVRNPVADSPAGIVRFGARLEPYTLGDLMNHMQTYRDPFEPQFRAWNPYQSFSRRATIARQETGVGARNSSVFQATRSFLWGRLLQDRIQPSYASAREYAVALNAQLSTPLPAKEIHELSASAVRQVVNGKGKPTQHGGATAGRYSEFCAAAGRQGGKATTAPKVAAASENAAKGREKRSQVARELTQQALELAAQGLATRAIAEALKRSVATVRRWLRSQRQTTKTTVCILQATGSEPVAASIPLPVAPAGELTKSYAFRSCGHASTDRTWKAGYERWAQSESRPGYPTATVTSSGGQIYQRQTEGAACVNDRMVKVDLVEASKTLNNSDGPGRFRPNPADVTREPYRREPYVRAVIDEETIDAKAAAWTETMVLIHWVDNELVAHNRWIPATSLRRIPRSESSWTDSYDDFTWYLTDPQR